LSRRASRACTGVVVTAIAASFALREAAHGEAIVLWYKRVI
jgi:hypothetical protein